VIVLCGATIVVVGFLQHARVLRRGPDEELSGWPFTITVIAFGDHRSRLARRYDQYHNSAILPSL
jgi:hypothetical protein